MKFKKKYSQISNGQYSATVKRSLIGYRHRKFSTVRNVNEKHQKTEIENYVFFCFAFFSFHRVRYCSCPGSSQSFCIDYKKREIFLCVWFLVSISLNQD